VLLSLLLRPVAAVPPPKPSRNIGGGDDDDDDDDDDGVAFLVGRDRCRLPQHQQHRCERRRRCSGWCVKG
jgi:hypothetical protein